MAGKTSITLDELIINLRHLRMNFVAESLDELIAQLTSKKLSNLEFFEEIIRAEVNEKEERAQQRRIQNSRLGLIKTLEEFKFHHPSKIDEEKIRYHNRLGFIERRQSLAIIGTVGCLGKHILPNLICIKYAWQVIIVCLPQRRKLLSS